MNIWRLYVIYVCAHLAKLLNYNPKVLGSSPVWVVFFYMAQLPMTSIYLQWSSYLLFSKRLVSTDQGTWKHWTEKTVENAVGNAETLHKAQTNKKNVKLLLVSTPLPPHQHTPVNLLPLHANSTFPGGSIYLALIWWQPLGVLWKYSEVQIKWIMCSDYCCSAWQHCAKTTDSTSWWPLKLLLRLAMQPKTMMTPVQQIPVVNRLPKHCQQVWKMTATQTYL